MLLGTLQYCHAREHWTCRWTLQDTGGVWRLVSLGTHTGLYAGVFISTPWRTWFHLAASSQEWSYPSSKNSPLAAHISILLLRDVMSSTASASVRFRAIYSATHSMHIHSLAFALSLSPGRYLLHPTPLTHWRISGSARVPRGKGCPV